MGNHDDTGSAASSGGKTNSCIHSSKGLRSRSRAGTASEQGAVQVQHTALKMGEVPPRAPTECGHRQSGRSANAPTRDVDEDIKAILNDPETEDWLAKGAAKKIKVGEDTSISVGAILNDPETKNWVAKKHINEKEASEHSISAYLDESPHTPPRESSHHQDLIQMEDVDATCRLDISHSVPPPSTPPPPHGTGLAIPRIEDPEANLPGAYAQAPGIPSERVDSVDLSIISNTASPQLLVQATPVAEDNNRVDATPMDLQVKNQNNQQYLIIKAGLMLIAIVSIFLGLFFGIGSMKTSEQQNQPTIVPTLSPSLTLTMAPSPAPPAVLDDLLSVLPNHTQASLNDYDSPQSKAFSWLSYHQNITNLPAWRKEQLFALSTFYYAMEGPHWPSYASDRWLDDSVSECLWFSGLTGYVVDGKWVELEDLNDVEDYYGSHQCNEQGQIHTIHLSQLGLGNYTPFIPPEIGSLFSLEKLYLGENDIAVSVDDMLPTQFGQLQHLLYIDFSWNAITGTIPSTIGLSLTNLPVLSLAGNSITGTLPSEIGLLTNITSFLCPSNNIHGSIPTEFGLLTDMTYLAMSGNEMTGAVPTELGLMRGMEYFYVLDNQFTVLPSELGLWTDLKQILLSRNSLSGPLPTQIGLWTKLDYLRLEENSFSGQIPSHLGRNITDIKLNENSFTGAIPSQLGLLESLDSLFLSNNSLSGPLPSELGLLVNLKELHISYNPLLSGTIPEEIGTLVTSHTLGVVDLVGSINLEGQIPEEVCFLQSPNCTYLPWPWRPPNSCSLEFDCVAGHGNGSEGLLCGCDCSCIDR